MKTGIVRTIHLRDRYRRDAVPGVNLGGWQRSDPADG